ncbi:MAG: hypothetical protein ACHQ4G_08730, partial [Opitutales bacterium]
MICAADQTEDERGRYLHAATIVGQDEAGNWTQIKHYTVLPAGVYVVPPAASPATTGLDFGPAW